MGGLPFPCLVGARSQGVTGVGNKEDTWRSMGRCSRSGWRGLGCTEEGVLSSNNLYDSHRNRLTLNHILP